MLSSCLLNQCLTGRGGGGLGLLLLAGPPPLLHIQGRGEGTCGSRLTSAWGSSAAMFTCSPRSVRSGSLLGSEGTTGASPREGTHREHARAVMEMVALLESSPGNIPFSQKREASGPERSKGSEQQSSQGAWRVGGTIGNVAPPGLSDLHLEHYTHSHMHTHTHRVSVSSLAWHLRGACPISSPFHLACAKG